MRADGSPEGAEFSWSFKHASYFKEQTFGLRGQLYKFSQQRIRVSLFTVVADSIKLCAHPFKGFFASVASSEFCSVPLSAASNNSQCLCCFFAVLRLFDFRIDISTYAGSATIGSRYAFDRTDSFL